MNNNKYVTVKRARIIYEITLLITIGCGVIGFILAICAAGTSDYYAEVKKIVPDNIDMKYGVCALILFIVSLIGEQIIAKGNFEIMYDLEKVPLYCTNGVNRKMEDNSIFHRQVMKSIDSYYNGEWGDLEVIDKEDNENAVEKGVGRVFGAYNTVLGKIYIITESDRSATTVLFAREY